MQDNIQAKVIELLEKKFSVPKERLNLDNWDKPLTGHFFQLKSVDLVYIFFELERDFEIRFHRSCLEDYGFCTINGIVRALTQTASKST